MNDTQLLNQISRKLSALLSIFLLQGESKTAIVEGERMLRRFQLTNQEIADILGTSKHTVEVMKSRDKKGGSKK